MKFRPSKAAPPARNGENPKNQNPNDGPSAGGARGAALDGWDDAVMDAAARGTAEAVSIVTPGGVVQRFDLTPPEPVHLLPHFGGPGEFMTAYGVRMSKRGGYEVVRLYVEGDKVIREELARQPEPYAASAYRHAEDALARELLEINIGHRRVAGDCK